MKTPARRTARKGAPAPILGYNRVVEFKVRPEQYALFPDPSGHTEREVHIFHTQVRALPQRMPADPNPRPTDEAPSNTLTREIKASLLAAGGEFYLMNGGLTIHAEAVENHIIQHGILRVFLDGPRERRYGIMNGLTTTRTVEEVLADIQAHIPPEQTVMIRIVTGLDATRIPQIVGAMSKTHAVHAESIMNLEGRFDLLQEVMRGQVYGHLIGWHERDTPRVISAPTLIAMLSLFNIRRTPAVLQGAHPMDAYKFKKGVLEAYDADPSTFLMGRRLLPDILRMADFVQHIAPRRFPRSVDEFRAQTWTREVAGEGKLPFNDRGWTAKLRLHDAALYPILAAFRAMVVDQSGQYVWDRPFDDVLDFVDRNLAEMLLETWDNARGSALDEDDRMQASTLGRDKAHWKSLLRIVLHALEREKDRRR